MADKKEKITRFFSPKANHVTIESGKRLIMEAVEQIVFCDGDRIVLKGAAVLEIQGYGLHLVELGNDNMAVEGTIRVVSFLEVGA